MYWCVSEAPLFSFFGWVEERHFIYTNLIVRVNVGHLCFSKPQVCCNFMFNSIFSFQFEDKINCRRWWTNNQNVSPLLTCCPSPFTWNHSQLSRSGRGHITDTDKVLTNDFILTEHFSLNSCRCFSPRLAVHKTHRPIAYIVNHLCDTMKCCDSNRTDAQTQLKFDTFFKHLTGSFSCL